MAASNSVLEMRQAIAGRFPDEARRADTRLVDGYFDPDAHATWLEEFSQATTDAMKKRDEKAVKDQLSFMSEQLVHGDAVVRQHIDVFYVESLMWDLDETLKSWAWGLIPSNLKELYVAMWGEPKS